MADQYVDAMLGQGETILAQGRQHWMALIRFALQPILVFLAAIACFAIGVWLTPTGDGLFDQIFRWIDTLLGLVTAGLFILAIAWFPLQCIRWIKRRYLITDRRVLYVEGWLRRNSTDAGLSMITDVSFRQTFLGRHMGYADLVISTAANRPLHFRQIRDAIDFKKAIMAAQQGTVVARADKILEQGGHAPVAAGATAAGATAAVVTTEIPASVAFSQEPPPEPVPPWDGGDVPQMAEDDLPPADPLIFGDVAADAPVVEAPAVEAPVAAAAEVVAPAAAAVTAAVTSDPGALADIDSSIAQTAGTEAPAGVEAVTETLARLADLRDSGAISAEDYEARKQVLLDRL